MLEKGKDRLFLESKAVKTKDYSLISGPHLWLLTITEATVVQKKTENRMM